MKSAILFLILFSIPALANPLASKFVKEVRALSATSEPIESLVYGNPDYGYFETTEILIEGKQVSAKLVPPGYRLPIEIYLKKKKKEGPFYYERTGTELFSFPLSSELIPEPMPKAPNFTSRFFVSSGAIGSSTALFILNRFAEVVWAYSLKKSRESLVFLQSLGRGRYAVLLRNRLFEIVNFDGTVEKSSNFMTPGAESVHHDFIYDGGNGLLTFSFEILDITKQEGTLPPGKYRIGTLINVDLDSHKEVTLWSAFADSVAVLGPKPRFLLNFGKSFEDSEYLSRDGIDLDHVNSLSHAPGKGYLVSFRNLNALVFLDESFRSVWSLGSTPGATIGTKGTDFEFYGQHHASILANGNILLLDNTSDKISRALELHVDSAKKEVKLVQTFQPNLPLYAAIKGSVYRLLNGNTVLGLPSALIPSSTISNSYIVEFDSLGNQIAQLSVKDANFTGQYRMEPIDTIGHETYLGSSL